MLFSRSDVDAALQLLADELLESNVQVIINVVGSAAVMYLVEREALTRDIDAIHSRVSEVNEIVEKIAREQNWPADWFNDGVKLFVSHFDTPKDWELRIDREGVKIYSAKKELLLAMKLLAGRGKRDFEDIEQLLTLCNINSVVQAERLFDSYYPTEIIATLVRAQLEQRFSS